MPPHIQDQIENVLAPALSSDENTSYGEEEEETFTSYERRHMNSLHQLVRLETEIKETLWPEFCRGNRKAESFDAYLAELNESFDSLDHLIDRIDDEAIEADLCEFSNMLHGFKCDMRAYKQFLSGWNALETTLKDYITDCRGELEDASHHINNQNFLQANLCLREAGERMDVISEKIEDQLSYLHKSLQLMRNYRFLCRLGVESLKIKVLAFETKKRLIRHAPEYFTVAAKKQRLE